MIDAYVTAKEIRIFDFFVACKPAKTYGQKTDQRILAVAASCGWDCVSNSAIAASSSVKSDTSACARICHAGSSG